MHPIYEALKRLPATPTAKKLIGAMKGMKWEARAGRSRSIGNTRHRAEHLHAQVEKVNGELFNVEFATFEAVGPDEEEGGQLSLSLLALQSAER